MIKEFKEFITRGNVIDLAVGVIIGGAFTTIVNALVSGIITPLIGVVIKLITGHKNLDSATQGMVFKINGVKFDYGMLISAIITFLITAFVLFLIVKAINKAQTILPAEKEDEASAPVETTDAILNDIRQLLKEQASQKINNTHDKQ
ncbi:large conductance mechanosensitive channel protein MscL [Vagococcus sp.]|uniref:large conductance mechanosensitive channel protein MscL n=1 Tax=Vagococcus sp. TaxID=1933889 RepID=UPI003F9D7397